MPLNAGYLVVNNYMMHPDLFLHILLWCNRRCKYYWLFLVIRFHLSLATIYIIVLDTHIIQWIFSSPLWTTHSTSIIFTRHHLSISKFPLPGKVGKKATLMQYLHGYFWRALCIRDFISRLMPYAQPTFTIRAQLCTWDTYTAPISFWNSQRGHRIKMPDPRNRWRRNFLCNGNVGRCST